MDQAKIEEALKAIEQQIAAIRAAIGGQQENAMVTPEAPVEPGKNSMQDFLSR